MWLQITKGQLSPGDGEDTASDNQRHFAIAAYTIQAGEAGVGAITSSQIKRKTEYGAGDIRIYVNDTLIASDIARGTAPIAFNVALGYLAMGDTVYVAFGGYGKKAYGAEFQFKIETN